MLSMGLLTYTMKTMALNNTLETFTLCCTYYFNSIAFCENVNSNSFTNIFINGIVAEFFCKLLRSCLSFCVVINFCFCGVLFFFVAKRKRKSIVPVRLGCFNLGNNTWTCFNNRTGSFLPEGSKMLVIPIFFPIIPFMVVQFMPARLLGHSSLAVTCHFECNEGSIPVCYRPFPLWGSTGSKQTLNGLFYVYRPELFFLAEAKLRVS